MIKLSNERIDTSDNFGSAVLEALQDFDEHIPLKTKCIGVPDIVVEHGAPGIIKKDLKLDPEGMFETICSFVNVSISSKIHENETKNFSGNGSNDLKTNIKKPTATQTANG